MPLNRSSMERKTKAQILDEYEKLVNNLGAVKQTAKEVHEPSGQKTISQATAIAGGEGEQLEKGLDEARGSLNHSLQQISSALRRQLDRLRDLKRATDLMDKNLQHRHHVTIVAETLDHLISEYEIKKQQFELDADQRQAALEAELTSAKRRRQQEQEEKDYVAAQKFRRDQQEVAEEIEMRQRELNDREAELEAKDEEFTALNKQVNGIPALIENRLKQQEKELIVSLTGQKNIEVSQLKQQHLAEKQVLELKIVNLGEQNKHLQSEINNLRAEAEKANKRVQELTLKVIDSRRPETKDPDRANESTRRNISA